MGGNYRFVLSFNSVLILLGALSILPPATSAMLHNLSTLGISLRSMTDLLEQKPSCKMIIIPTKRRPLHKYRAAASFLV